MTEASYAVIEDEGFFHYNVVHCYCQDIFFFLVELETEIDSLEKEIKSLVESDTM